MTSSPLPPELREDARVCLRDITTMAQMHLAARRDHGQLPDLVDIMKFSVLCSFAELVEKGIPVKHVSSTSCIAKTIMSLCVISYATIVIQLLLALRILC